MPIDSLTRLIQQFEQQPRWRSRRQFRLVQENWSQIVGAAVACHARPVRLERNILYVAVANPMWGQTLTLERSHVLTKLQQQFQIELQDIRFSNRDWYRRSSQMASPQPQADQPLALPEWLRHHPSFEPEAVPPSASKAAAETPLESFQRWANRNQQLARHQPLCPACRCPCPEGELRRWSVCCICAAQKFNS
jgi:predicted nucleic acid-binding Zn ribbon protein